MLMLIAATITKEEVIMKLEEAVNQYNEVTLLNNEEKLKQADQELFVATNLFIMQYITKGDVKVAMQHIKAMDEIDRAKKFFETPKN